MKVLIVSLCIACASVFAQDNPQDGRAVGILRIQKRFFAQPAKYPATFKGNFIEKDGTVITLRGDVEVKTDSVIVRADKAVYHNDTGEIEATGNVRISRIGQNQ
jgi:lipopolysaccharide assembly outer membrane protein LptD (OstA)